MRGVWRLSPSSEDMSPESEDGENTPNKGDCAGLAQEREQLLLVASIVADREGGRAGGWHGGRRGGGERRRRTCCDGIYSNAEHGVRSARSRERTRGQRARALAWLSHRPITFISCQCPICPLVPASPACTAADLLPFPLARRAQARCLRRPSTAARLSSHPSCLPHRVCPLCDCVNQPVRVYPCDRHRCHSTTSERRAREG